MTYTCSASNVALLGSAHQAGKLIASSPQFGACIQHRMSYLYKPCLDPEDPFLGQPLEYQALKALTIMRSTNVADVGVTCASIDGDAYAGYDEYGDDFEALTIDTSYLAGILAHGVGDYELADVAGTIWHEAMHQQTYKHSGEAADDFCGYAAGAYERDPNSVPYNADHCMRSAGIHSRLYAVNEAGTAQSFGLGRHLANAGDFSIVGNDQITALRLPPASHVKYCSDEGAGAGAGTCVDRDNVTLEYGPLVAIPLGGISFIELEPRSLAFSEPNFGGATQAFTFGEARADHGDLAIVGNDRMRSIYVPPGMRVRACEHEGGPAGHGSGRCVYYDEPRSDLGTMSNNISYLDVEPAVTAYREANGFGAWQTFGRGAHIGANGGLGQVGDNHIVALVVPNGLTARVCTDYTLGGAGIGTCRNVTRTTFDLDPASAPSTVSYLGVLPYAVADLQPIGVSTIGAGTVVSSPFGIRCGLGGACSASFYRRGLVKLVANPTHEDAHTDWAGCDRVQGNDCYVSAMGPRTVTATFRDDVVDQDCYRDCLAACLKGPGPKSDCDDDCARDCTL